MAVSSVRSGTQVDTSSPLPEIDITETLDPDAPPPPPVDELEAPDPVTFWPGWLEGNPLGTTGGVGGGSGVGAPGGSAGPTPRPMQTAPAPANERPSGPREAPRIETHLGKRVDEIINKSPHLRSLWDRAKAQGYDLQLTTDGASRVEGKKILINLGNVQEGGDFDAKLVSLLSHELGHTMLPLGRDLYGSTREEFTERNVERALDSEGEAALANLIAREEIEKAGGPNIGIRGGLDVAYQIIYERFKEGPPEGITREEAIRLLGQRMAKEPEDNGQTKEQNFTEIYQRKWDATHPP